MVAFVLLAHLAVAQPAAANFSGKVVETTNAAGYTYVLVDNGTQKVWATTTTFNVKVGDTATFSMAMPMKNFHSDAMNRDFAEIYFTSGVDVNGAQPAAQLPSGHPNGGGGMPPNHPAPSAPAKVDFSNLKPAASGKTIAEIFAASAQLNGQPVLVRGKVVKYNAGIMGRNWVHIQDGTGTEGSKDLLVTTTDTAALGDTVLVSGKVAINQDFGAGYKYSVLIEAAKVTAE